MRFFEAVAPHAGRARRRVAGTNGAKPDLPPRSAPGTVRLMHDWSKCAGVERIPGKLGGAWLFKGTRVPVKALFQNLTGGATVDNFLEWFPGVSRIHVEAVLDHSQRSLADAWSPDA